MGRHAALTIFSAIGFGIGFLGYLAMPTLYDWMSTPLTGLLHQGLWGAVVSGVAGGIASLWMIIRWGRS